MVRAWKNVVGVKVAQADEDIDHCRLKPALVETPRGGVAAAAAVESDQTACKRALQRQVRVELFQHQNRLIDQQFTLAHRQGSDGATGRGLAGAAWLAPRSTCAREDRRSSGP